MAIPYGRQSIDDSDIAAVVDVLRSEFLTQGPAVPAFEKAVQEQCAVNHALAVNSGTSALHLACLALGVGPGDIVWTSAITFVASANCARYCGAEADFVDIDPRTYNISIEALERKLQAAAKERRLPKLVVAVHLCGLPCDMAELHALSTQYGFRIVEDASHALGGTYRGEPVGSCRYSEMTVLSFHPVKIITSGEGGMVTTNNAALAKRVALLRSHGITRHAADMSRRPEGEWYYEQTELGWNYRMTDIHAALGRSQMKRLSAFMARRTTLAARYDELLADAGLHLPHRSADRVSGWHLYVIRWSSDASPLTRAQAFSRLRQEGIGVNVHYIPVPLQPYYRRLGFKPGQFPNAEAYYAEAITLPLYAALTDQEQDQVVRAVRSLLRQRGR